MDDPRLSFGCFPLLAGVMLVVLGYHFTIEPFESLGVFAVAGEVLVLVRASLGRPRSA
jgi:hypothetical protein